MLQHSRLQGRPFQPMDVSRNRDLVELKVEMLVADVSPLQMDNAAYMVPISTRPLPTSMLRQHSTPQGHQFKPMDITCSRDMVELWVEIPPPPSDGHHTLYLSLLAPTFTDDYAPA
jgi:hypothetical protein